MGCASSLQKNAGCAPLTEDPSENANPHALKPTATRPQFKAETVPPEAKAKNRNEPPDGEMGAEQKLLGLLAKEEAEEAAWELTADKQQSIASEGAAESISAPDGGASIDGEMVGCGEAAKAKGAIVVTRREARNMTDVEQERFAKAVLHMMERHNGASTSEYFRIAGLHGYPSDHCHLAQETFPGWHRLYLVEFEQALRAADRALGNDGNIGCPYWDWTRDEANGQVLPALARRYFERVPQGLLEDLGDRASMFPGGCYRRRSEKQLLARLRASEVSELTRQCLAERQHWKHASTRWGGRSSIEAPHNRIHVAVGWPMSSVEFAAFDPVFWLHHCNLDRIYQRYITENADSAEEMCATQQYLQQHKNEPNRFEEPLEPFAHPCTGELAVPSDAFGDTEALHYCYDELPEAQPSPPGGAPPILAMFKDIKVQNIPEGHCYELHLFVSKASSPNTLRSADGPGRFVNVVADRGWVPAEDPDDWWSLPGYAGFGSVFACSPSRCHNCRARGPIVETVDISAALQRLGLSHHEAVLQVAVVNELMQVVPLNMTTLPSPEIVAPLFCTNKGQDGALSDPARKGDIMSLQAHLLHLGYAAGAVDGWFGPKTMSALASYQADMGVEGEKGILGAATVSSLTRKRMDTHPLRTAADNPGRLSSAGSDLWQSLRVTISLKSEIKYWIGKPPGYLHEPSAREEVLAAFEVWETLGIWRFTRVDKREEADCTVTWEFPKVPSCWSDGAGGSLAVATTCYVQLDAAERWALQGEGSNKPGEFELLPVLVHEIGHLLGLDHSIHRGDVMFPYYTGENATKLSNADKQQASTMYLPSR